MPVKLIKPKRFGDERGWFVETYNAGRYADLGIGVTFVQDNHSMSAEVGTLRGLHFQAPPNGQDKLVRCVRGRIWDVAVDIRKGSPTWGQWVGAELSAENGWQLFVPIGVSWSPAAPASSASARGPKTDRPRPSTIRECCVVDKLTYAGNLASSRPSRIAIAIASSRPISAMASDARDLRRFRPDIVMHLAAESHVDRSIDGPSAFIETNIVGTFAMLQEALGIGAARRGTQGRLPLPPYLDRRGVRLARR
jgi:hypothetical protein